MSHRNPKAVVFWMTGSLLSFSAVALSIRGLAGQLSVFEILTIRNAAGAIILLAYVALRAARGGAGLPRPQRMPLHLLRNSLHFVGQAAWAYGVMLLPLATVFAIEFTAPAWVALMAVLILGERLTTPRLAAVLLGLAGVLLVLRPGAASLDTGSLVVLLSAFAFAATTITTKALTRTESTLSILIWMNLMQLPMNFAGSDPWFWTRLPEAPLLPLVGICVSGLLAHLCLTNAYRHGDALMVVPLDFLRIPLIAFIGFALYGEPLDAMVFAGAALIGVGILWNLRAEAGAARAAAAKG